MFVPFRSSLQDRCEFAKLEPNPHWEPEGKMPVARKIVCTTQRLTLRYVNEP